MVNPRPRNRRVRDEDPGNNSAFEWQSRTLAEVQTSKGVLWRAQISTSPDGKKFAGIRKIAVKKDGTEVVTRDGISFPYDGATINEDVDRIVDLLNKLKGGRVRIEDATKYVLVDKLSNKLIGVSSSTGKVAHSGNGPWKGNVRIFDSVEKARAYRTHNGLDPAKWRVLKV